MSPQGEQSIPARLTCVKGFESLSFDKLNLGGTTALSSLWMIVPFFSHKNELYGNSNHITLRSSFFIEKVDIMFSTMKADLNAYLQRDPAARNKMEVFFLYSGYKAVRKYRRAHWFHIHNMKFIARWLSQRARNKTGVEIHPAATIGKGLVIDHGMGVVIGETTVIGDNCLIYQNVTLGGTGKEHGKRHPTLGDNVMVGSGAKVLGPFKVGDNSRIAAGAVVLTEIPPNCTAVGVPARVVRINGVRPDLLDQIHYSDPVAMELCRMHNEIQQLGQEVQYLKKSVNKTVSPSSTKPSQGEGYQSKMTLHEEKEGKES